MALILNIESATTVCSVSLALEGKLVKLKELDNGYSHAENLHVFICDILKESKTPVSALHAVAVSKGPGSYTGLRIGASAAKGMAYALGIPLIGVNTLQIMAAAAKTRNNSASFYCPMIDARRMEVYTSVFDTALQAKLNTQALILNEKSTHLFNDFEKISFFGNGMSKCRPLLASLKNACFIDNVVPSAAFMCELSYLKYSSASFEDVAGFEPLYLKDFLIVKKN